MKNILGLGMGLAGVMLGSGVVFAADMGARPVYKAPMMASAYSWTGWYVGGNAGYAWGDWDTAATTAGRFATTNFPITSAFLAANQPALAVDGFTGGGQLGYNWQNGAWVVGVEGDFNYFGLDQSFAFGANPVPGTAAPLAVTGSVSAEWLATIRGRLGFAVDSWLFYVTGGLALSELRFDETVRVASAGGIPGAFTASVSQTQAGWTLGGGVEWAIGGPWTARVEYLHVDLGDFDTTARLAGPLAAGTNAGSTATFRSSLTSDIVRAGLNYRF